MIIPHFWQGRNIGIILTQMFIREPLLQMFLESATNGNSKLRIPAINRNFLGKYLFLLCNLTQTYFSESQPEKREQEIFLSINQNSQSTRDFTGLKSSDAHLLLLKRGDSVPIQSNISSNCWNFHNLNQTKKHILCRHRHSRSAGLETPPFHFCSRRRSIECQFKHFEFICLPMLLKQETASDTLPK